jgi:hypothetical protein
LSDFNETLAFWAALEKYWNIKCPENPSKGTYICLRGTS